MAQGDNRQVKLKGQFWKSSIVRNVLF